MNVRSKYEVVSHLPADGRPITVIECSRENWNRKYRMWAKPRRRLFAKVKSRFVALGISNTFSAMFRVIFSVSHEGVMH